MSCARETSAPSASSRTEPVVYDTDDRVDVYEHANASYRSYAAQSTVALISTWALSTSNPANCTTNTSNLESRYNLCAGARFATQPAASYCSGTLIDDDLVLTAGHCIDESGSASMERCGDTYFVFDYRYEAAGRLATIQRAEDVYTCRDIVAYQNSGGFDYAIIRLDRRATAAGKVVRPVRTSRSALASGMGVVLIGYPSGLPAKIADGAIVTNPRGATLDFFGATVDAFGGNSGSGVFDTSGNVVGILVRGATDYLPETGPECKRVNTVSSSGAFGESVTYVHRAIDALCASGHASPRLCGAADVCGDGSCTGGETESSCVGDCFVHRCGDGVCGGTETGSSCASDCVTFRCGDGACNGSETTTSCPADCVTWVCGDGVCNVTETESSCRADCYVEPEPVIPSGWTCPEAFYDSRDGCHCGCGVGDPDCAVLGQSVRGCGSAEICTSAGSCLLILPSTWTCSIESYHSGDACDCNCGAYDPDCNDPNLAVNGCPGFGVCNSQGTCEVGAGEAGSGPRWLCAASEYNDGTTCNCRCGIYDPDCANASNAVLRCPSGFICGTNAECEPAPYVPPQGDGGTTGRDAGGGTPGPTMRGEPKSSCAARVSGGEGSPFAWAALVSALALLRQRSRKKPR